MNLFPYKSYSIKTDLPPEEIERVLSKSIAPFKIARLFFVEEEINNESYHGKIHGGRFTIQRIITGRNSFLPIIEGRVFKTVKGAEIKIQMRLAVYTYVIWFTIIGFLSYGLFEVVKLMILKQTFSAGSLILFCLLIFCYLFCLLSFNWEIAKSTRYLEGLFAKKKSADQNQQFPISTGL